MRVVEEMLTKHIYYCAIFVISVSIHIVWILHLKRFLLVDGNANGEGYCSYWKFYCMYKICPKIDEPVFVE